MFKLKNDVNFVKKYVKFDIVGERYFWRQQSQRSKVKFLFYLPCSTFDPTKYLKSCFGIMGYSMHGTLTYLKHFV